MKSDQLIKSHLKAIEEYKKTYDAMNAFLQALTKNAMELQKEGWRRLRKSQPDTYPPVHKKVMLYDPEWCDLECDVFFDGITLWQDITDPNGDEVTVDLGIVDNAIWKVQNDD